MNSKSVAKNTNESTTIENIKYDDLNVVNKVNLTDKIVYEFLYEILVLNSKFLLPSKEKVLSNNKYGIFYNEKISKNNNKTISEFEISNFVDYVYSEAKIRENRDKLNGMSIDEEIILDVDDKSKVFYKVKLTKIFDKRFDLVKNIGLKFDKNFSELLIATIAHFKFQKNECIRDFSRFAIKEQIANKILFEKISDKEFNEKLKQEQGHYLLLISDDYYVVYQKSSNSLKEILDNEFIKNNLTNINIRFDLAAEYIAKKEWIDVTNEDIVKEMVLNTFLITNNINRLNKIYWLDEIEILKSQKYSKSFIKSKIKDLNEQQIKILKKSILRNKVIDFLLKLNSNNTSYRKATISENRFIFNRSQILNSNKKV